MSDRNLILLLAKVASAAAWADSEIGSIVSWLHLPRQAFIDAKVKIPAEQGAG